MKRLRAWIVRLGGLFRAERRTQQQEQELAAELESHLQFHIDDNLRAGMTLAEARRDARIKLGGVEQTKQAYRERSTLPWIENLLRDVRYALRQLRRSPGFTITAIVTLALGIGANTAIFSVVNALMLRPLPYPQPTRIGELVTRRDPSLGMEDDNSADGDTYFQVRDGIPALMVAAYGMETGVNMQAGTSIQFVQNLRVTARYFNVLGIPPQMGRSLSAEEDRPNGPKVAILSHALWRSTFHADPKIIGKSILLKGESYTVVGVLAPGAQSPQPADVWTPLRPSRTGEGGGTNYGVLLRLKSGSTWAQAKVQLGKVMPQSFRYEMSKNPNQKMYLVGVPLQQSEASALRPAVLGLMVAVGFILLIACANLAGLGLVRATERSGEMATRLALGATGLMLARQLWIENLLVAFAGGAASLSIASGSLALLQHLLPPGLLPTSNFTLDGRVLLFTLGVSLVTSILFGMLPMLELRRIDLRSAMAAGGNRASTHAANRRTRMVLISGEIALTVVLMAGAGLLIRSLIYLETLPPGFDATHVMTGKVSLDDARYHDAAAFQHLLTTSLDAMCHIPGVEKAAVGLSLPYERGLNIGSRIPQGKDIGRYHTTNAVYVTPEYFDALRMHLLAGREFSDSDTAQSQPVVIVNDTYARKLLGQPNAVGMNVSTVTNSQRNWLPLAVVGVVADVVKTPALSAGAPLTTEPMIYFPAAQADQNIVNMAHIWFQPSWIVRTRGPVSGITEAMQKALAQADPALPFSGFYSMKDLEQRALSLQRLEVWLLGALAGLALLLSAIGVYGLISNLVVQRTCEIGIRLALGAQRGNILWMVLRDAGRLIALGLLLGIAASLAGAQMVQSLLFKIAPRDPVTLITICGIMLLTGLFAAWWPARRAANIDPMQALRAE